VEAKKDNAKKTKGDNVLDRDNLRIGREDNAQFHVVEGSSTAGSSTMRSSVAGSSTVGSSVARKPTDQGETQNGENSIGRAEDNVHIGMNTRNRRRHVVRNHQQCRQRCSILHRRNAVDCRPPGMLRRRQRRRG
jgi:hypothetical protein